MTTLGRERVNQIDLALSRMWQMKGRERLKAMDRALEEKNKELDDAKQWKRNYESTNSQLMELELIVGELREELKKSLGEKEEIRNQAKTEKDDRDEVSHRVQSSKTLYIGLHEGRMNTRIPQNNNYITGTRSHTSKIWIAILTIIHNSLSNVQIMRSNVVITP